MILTIFKQLKKWFSIRKFQLVFFNLSSKILADFRARATFIQCYGILWLRAAHCRVYTAYWTLNTEHCLQQISHCQIHVIHSKHHGAHCTVQAMHCTPPTFHTKLGILSAVHSSSSAAFEGRKKKIFGEGQRRVFLFL